MHLQKGLYFDLQKSNAWMGVICSSGSGSKITLNGMDTEDPTLATSPTRFTVKGSFSAFAYCLGRGYISSSISGNTYPVFFNTVGDITGTRYYLRTGGAINTPAPTNADTDKASVTKETYFPGSTTGDMPSAENNNTYCWIA